MNVFTYGSLMIPSVMAAVTGKRFLTLKASLKEYARFRVNGESYPGLMYAKGATTEGIVHCDVDALSLKLLDKFEGELYKRISARAEDEGHGSLVVETYVFDRGQLHLLSSEPWDFEEFKRNHLQEFMRTYKGFSSLKENG